LDILERYGLLDRVLPAVRNHIREGVKGNREETPKEGDPFFQDVCNVIVGSNFQALRAAQEWAEKLGFNPLILSSFVQGETREVAGVHAAIGREILSTGNPVSRPACVTRSFSSSVFNVVTSVNVITTPSIIFSSVR
jgi:hydroxypyruvate reductase